MINAKTLEQTFSKGSSTFLKVVLAPCLAISVVVSFLAFQDAVSEHRIEGIIACTAFNIVCICGLLALWGVPYCGRIVTGLIALAFAYFFIDEWFITENSSNKLNPALGLFCIGLPCLLYTIMGRFSIANNDDIALESVMIHFQYGSMELNPIFELSEKLDTVFEEQNLGFVDGNEISNDGSDAYLFMIGANARSIFETAKPILLDYIFMHEAEVSMYDKHEKVIETITL